jgi:hypothetical protein
VNTWTFTWFAVAAGLLATGWHAIAEHHVHLRLLHRIRPRTVVPVTAHHAWWHTLTRARRLAIQGALLLAAAAFAVAYPLAPDVVTIVFAITVAAATGLGIRAHATTRRTADGPRAGGGPRW